jgi:uncharacterized FAD-dependent dehydrogenase
MIRIFDITLQLGEGEDLLAQKISGLLEVPEKEVRIGKVVRKSLDARRSRPPRFVYVVDATVSDEKAVMEKKAEKVKIKLVEEAPSLKRSRRPARTPERRPVVVGCGPAGLFGALTLASHGVAVLLLERGKPVSERIADTESFWNRGDLNRESNVHFGEGGAGTFSDGKLTTRLRDGRMDWVKQTLVDLGAPPEVLTEGKPHVGTDRLRQVVVNLRKKLVDLDCEIRFHSKVTDFILDNDRLAGVIVHGREEIRTDHLILAIGQSAVETYEKLRERGVALVPKPFAMGLRVEHPQGLIDGIQYGRWRHHKDLPPADYFLTAKVAGLERAVYTFCMCPGGQVIGCGSGEGEVVTNGMSLYRRGSPFANSAVVVNVRTDDFAGESPLCGIAFRSQWERKAFLLGGGDYRAPAQRLTDFVSGKESRDIGPSSFKPGVTVAPLKEAVPSFVYEALRRGLLIFNEKMPGFLTSEASLTGVETRTSSPVRILRGEDGQSVAVRGLYPCGEGAGYAGGIMSSALDGIRAAEEILKSLNRSGKA